MISLNKQFLNDVPLKAKEEIHGEFKTFYNTFSDNHSEKQTAIVWMLTTYPPKECGIATFSQDLRESLGRVYGNSIKINIAAIDDKNQQSNYPEEVSCIFNSSDTFAYSRFSALVNHSHAKALIIQHEFGLFPEENYKDFLDMLAEITKPVLMVMHTVIPAPAPGHKKKTIDLIDKATRVIVMTKRSAAILQNDYDIPLGKIEIILHGTHLTGHFGINVLKEELGLKNRIVLSTFGLISRNKNIETSLRALPAIVKKFPEVIFVILGRLHPEVFKKEGDTYYRELKEIVNNLHLNDHVKFMNHYLSLKELMKYLQATDIYLFTSKDPAQAVSGTFSYALSSGCAIVSTPIAHAKELLENDCGLLFEFEDPQSLSIQILRYLNDPVFREKTRKNALELMANTAWENIAIRYMDTLKNTCRENLYAEFKLPEINVEHLEKLTTEKGIFQFARYNQPEPSSGYTLDDNARAMIVATMLYSKTGEHKMLQLAKIYLQFIKDCQLPAGNFINYVNVNGTPGSKNKNVNLEDSNGRAIWALGYLISIKKMPLTLQEEAQKIFMRAIPGFDLVRSPRSIAFILKGLYYCYLNGPSPQLKSLIENLAGKLLELYQNSTDGQWKWFEPYFTYANSILSESMLMAYQITSKDIYKQVAGESFDFLLSKIFVHNQIKVIPNKGWLHKGQNSSNYGEQPIDVAYTIVALDRFYREYNDENYASKLRIAFNWFLGENHLKRIIYNPATGGCFDGLEENSVNLNQGAESTVSYLLARLTVDTYFKQNNPDMLIPDTFFKHNLFQ